MYKLEFCDRCGKTGSLMIMGEKALYSQLCEECYEYLHELEEDLLIKQILEHNK